MVLTNGGCGGGALWSQCWVVCGGGKDMRREEEER